MRRKTFTILTLALTLFGCGKSVSIDETHFFKNNCWMRFEPEVFIANINNTDDYYNIYVTLKYDTNFLTTSTLPITVNFYADSNEKHNIMPELRLRDKKGQLRGTTIENYCTVTDTIERLRLYNTKGDYTYKISQRTSKYELHGVSSIGLKIEKTEL